MFWKWGLSPRNPRDDFLQVAAPDPTFTDIVVPGAKSALEFAKRSSPLQNCEKARAETPLNIPPAPASYQCTRSHAESAASYCLRRIPRHRVKHGYQSLPKRGFVADSFLTISTSSMWGHLFSIKAASAAGWVHGGPHPSMKGESGRPTAMLIHEVLPAYALSCR